MAVTQSVTLARSAQGFKPVSGGIFDAFEISGSGLSAQRRKLNAISSNIANVDTTRTEEGGPYKRKRVVAIESPFKQRFNDLFNERNANLSATHSNHMPAGPQARAEELLGAGVETVEIR
ncbi:TPA: hypothetical protein DCE37_14290, partial [Candidatus Latescibacteria bacterium]|nr:hypothetical protein [Candidatus Latescibacterota bacterium]